MDDLIAFVRARLDDDERYVRAVKTAGERLKANPDPRMAEFAMSAADAFLDNWDDLAEFTRWKCAVPADLDRQLREVAAKRAILADVLEDDDGGGIYGDPWHAGASTAGERALKNLATAWSDHPDYRQEWKPDRPAQADNLPSTI